MRKNGRITAYIHMNAIADNFEKIRSKIDKDTSVIVVVKADGYGHGAVPIAQMAESYDYIWGYAVASVAEGMQLREAGVKKPVLVLGYSFEEDYETMIQNEIRPTLFTVEMAQSFACAAQGCGKQVPVHLAVDTGMSRIGVQDTEEGLRIAEQISKMSPLWIEGVFTHFARADELDKSNAREQAKRFSDFCDELNRRGINGFARHCANSAGIMELADLHMDAVRAGIIIYGIYPSDEMDREAFLLRPAMELKSHVIHVKTIPAGTPVSYGGTFVAEQDMTVATIPVGYADGYPRSLSNVGSVLINGKRARILGRVCMDQFMADVTGLPVSVLDEVTLLGTDGEDEITIDELAELSGRFPYEFVCDIEKRVPRVYIP